MSYLNLEKYKEKSQYKDQLWHNYLSAQTH